MADILRVSTPPAGDRSYLADDGSVAAAAGLRRVSNRFPRLAPRRPREAALGFPPPGNLSRSATRLPGTGNPAVRRLAL
jgi:hypothetical protein